MSLLKEDLSEEFLEGLSEEFSEEFLKELSKSQLKRPGTNSNDKLDPSNSSKKQKLLPKKSVSKESIMSSTNSCESSDVSDSHYKMIPKQLHPDDKKSSLIHSASCESDNTYKNTSV